MMSRLARILPINIAHIQDRSRTLMRSDLECFPPWIQVSRLIASIDGYAPMGWYSFRNCGVGLPVWGEGYCHCLGYCSSCSDKI
jgi:hypothetical protein